MVVSILADGVVQTGDLVFSEPNMAAADVPLDANCETLEGYKKVQCELGPTSTSLGIYQDERLQVAHMMRVLTGLVLPMEVIDREIAWVDEHMGEEGWIDRVARGRQLIMLPLLEVSPYVRMAVPLCVGWAGQVYQFESDRGQGGLSDPEQLLLTNLMSQLDMTSVDYDREWSLLFR
jgi:hypothetical protein